MQRNCYLGGLGDWRRPSSRPQCGHSCAKYRRRSGVECMAKRALTLREPLRSSSGAQRPPRQTNSHPNTVAQQPADCSWEDIIGRLLPRSPSGVCWLEFAVIGELSGNNGSATAIQSRPPLCLCLFAYIPGRLAGEMRHAADTVQKALDQAIAPWQRRRYRITYRDAHLVQLLKRDAPDEVLTVGTLAALCAIAVLILVRHARRRWHIVSLTATVDARVITHHQRAKRPPPQVPSSLLC